MNAPLSRYLTRFDAEGAPPPLALSFEPELDEPDMEMDAEPEVAEDDAGVVDAEEQGITHVAHEQAIDALKAAHEIALSEAVAAARIEWAQAEASAIAPLLDAAVGQLRDLMEKRIATVLKPLVAEAIVARTVKMLGQTIDRILKDPKRPVLSIRGPADLIEAVRAQRPLEDGMTFEEAEGVEVMVTANGMHIQTRLGNALAKLAAKER